MLDAEEWDWLDEHAAGDFDHLLIGTSLPFLLAPGCTTSRPGTRRSATAPGAGRWWSASGPPGARPRALGGVRRVARARHGGDPQASAGGRGAPPASIVALSGDVHHAYLAEVGFPRGTGMRSNVYQATCSPFRNPLDEKERALRIAMASGRFVEAAGPLAGVGARRVRWRFAARGPWFDNQVATSRSTGGARCGSRRPCRMATRATTLETRVRARPRLARTQRRTTP